MAKSQNIAGGSGSHQSVANRPGRRLKKQLAGDGVIVGGILGELFQPVVVKLYAHAGFDFIFLEYEHTFVDPAQVVHSVLCARDNGLPVIASNVGGIVEIIKDGVNGYLVEPRNVELLSNRIVRLLKDQELRSVMGRSGYNMIDKKYNWEKAGEMFNNIINEI